MLTPKIELNYQQSIREPFEIIEENKNDPIFKLLTEYDEIQQIINSNKDNLMNFLYLNKKTIHRILYDNDEIITIENNMINNKLSYLIYLFLLIEDEKEIVNYEYSLDFIIDIYELLKQDNSKIKNILLSIIIAKLISNYRNTNNNSENDEDKLNEIESYINNNKKNYIKDMKEFIPDLNENNNNEMKIDKMISDIINKLITTNKIDNNEYTSKVIKELDLENMNLTKTMFEEIKITLDENNKYLEKYIIKDISDLNDDNIINFYYILFKFILKLPIYIYHIPFLSKTKKKIIKIIKTNKDNSKNIKNNENFKYVFNFITDTKYYDEKYFPKSKEKEKYSIDDIRLVSVTNNGFSQANSISNNRTQKGKELKDNKSLVDYHIQKESTIILIISLTISKKNLVKDLSGKTLFIDANSSDTIENIKEKIKDKEGILPKEYKLSFLGKKLEDDKTLDFYKILNQTTLDLVPNGIFQIFIENINGQKFNIDVEFFDTIKNIKEKIEDKEQIPVEQQILFFEGKILEDNQTIFYYNIQKESIILLKLNIKIYVHFIKGETFTLYVEPSDTIKTIKEKITKKEKIPIEKQKLIFDSQILEENRNLQFYNIKNESTLYISDSGSKIIIYVKTWIGITLTLDIAESDKISSIKKEIESKLKIFNDIQRLTYKGISLEDDKIFRDYNIPEFSTIDFVINFTLRVGGDIN